MPSLTTQQKTAVSQFVSFTQLDKKTAERVSGSRCFPVKIYYGADFTRYDGETIVLLCSETLAIT